MKSLIKKFINRETISYLIFGILTTGVDYIIYALLRMVHVNYILANCISWFFAVLFALITNKILVFKSKAPDKKSLFYEILMFYEARIISLLASNVIMLFAVSILGVNDFIAKIFAGIFVVVINYIFSKWFIFNNEKEMTGGVNLIKENLLYVFSFLVPVVVITVLFIIRKVYPFGDQMYLRSDCYHQYAPFHKELWRKITSGESLSYSWNIGMGSNFVALYAYYLASPLNWVIGFVSESHITEIMGVFIIGKIGLCGSTFCYYLSKKLGKKSYLMAAFSIFYALSSYMCAYSWNLMWLDCLLLFPLIVLGLERLVKEKKYMLYTITLALAVISNYYIAIMICIFSVLYFLVLLFTHSQKTKNYYISRCSYFAVFSLIAGGLAAFLFVPAFYALSLTGSGELDFPTTLDRYFSVLQMLSRSLISVDPAVFEPHDPNIYCTVAVWILLPLYWCCTKTNHREKIGKTVLLGILLVSFNLNIPNYIWHGFHFPNSLPCRESFIYIFLVLTMSYEALSNIKDFTNKQFYGSFGFSVIMTLLFEQLFTDTVFTYETIYLTLLFLVLYLFVLGLMRKKEDRQIVLYIYLFFVLAIGETFTNIQSGFSTTSRTSYLKDNEAISTLIEQVENEDSSFYRMEKYSRRTKNDGAWHGYRSSSIFSSTCNSGVTDFFGKLGLEESFNAYSYYGHTPLTEAITNVKYVFSNEIMNEDSLRELYSSNITSNSDLIYLYENKYVLPLGFVIPENYLESMNHTTSNPFSYQNSLANAFGCEEEMFSRLEVETGAGDNTVNIDEDMHLFIHSTTTMDTLKVEITDSDEFAEYLTFDNMNHRHSVDIGQVEKGSKVRVYSGDADVTNIQIYAYNFHEDVFLSFFQNLKDGGLTLDTIEDTYLAGSIQAQEDGYIYTSIPYDPGWTICVDGEEVKAEKFEDAFLLIPVKKGSHEITLSYTVPGLYLGITLSLISLIGLIMISICVKKIHKRQKELEKELALEREREKEKEREREAEV